MPTDKERIQKLFQAALLDTNEKQASLARAFPSAAVVQAGVIETAPVQSASLPISAPTPETAPVVPPDFVQPLAQAGLCETVSTELGILLEEQYRRKVSRRRREVLMTFVLLLGLTGGSFAWFVHSPQRVLAAKHAIKEIRSAGDVGAIVASYQKALAKIGTRTTEIDVATESMGVSSDQTAMKDVDMDAEMKQLMGDEGKTIGERNRLLKEKFGDLEKTGGKLIPPPAATKAAKPGSTPVNSVKPAAVPKPQV